MGRSDCELMQAIAGGDAAAFADFYDRHSPRVLGLVRRILGNPGDAEDVLQETFWQVWERVPAGQVGARNVLFEGLAQVREFLQVHKPA